MLPEKLLLHNAIGTTVGTTFTFVDGQQPSSTDIVVDGIGDTIDLWTRLRALLNTLAYISIQKPSWFSYGDAEELSDQFLVWMNVKYDKRRLPLQFFCDAYVATFQMFFEEIRLRGSTLSFLAKQQANFRSFWTQTSAGALAVVKNPPVMSPPVSAPPSGSSSPHPDATAEIFNEMKKLRSMNDKLHAKIDQQRSSSSGGGGNHNFGGGGGGKNFGKGRNGQNGGRNNNYINKSNNRDDRRRDDRNDGGGKRQRYTLAQRGGR